MKSIRIRKTQNESAATMIVLKRVLCESQRKREREKITDADNADNDGKDDGALNNYNCKLCWAISRTTNAHSYTSPLSVRCFAV